MPMSLRSTRGVKMREAPWSAAAPLRCRLTRGKNKAVAGATALQGASRIFIAVAHAASGI
jgi:hypothetical protein